MSPGKHWGHPVVTHPSCWRPVLAARWEPGPPDRPSSMILRQERGLHPWTSVCWVFLPQGQGEGGPPEQAPLCQAEGQGCWALLEEVKLPWCCHQGPSKTRATQLWPPLVK